MTGFLQRFKRAWLAFWFSQITAQHFAVFTNYFPIEHKDLPAWTEKDRASLAQFLNTESGGKLKVSLQSLEQFQNRNAVVRASHNEYSAGWAAGWRGCSAWLESISVIDSPEEIEKPADATLLDGAALADRLTPS